MAAQKCDQLVIGRGASGLSFLFYSRESKAQKFAAAKTIVIGRDDLWAKVSRRDKDHRFGQPQQIVSAPASSQSTVQNPEFQTAKQINDQLRGMERDLSKREGITFLNGEANAIKRISGGFEVEFTEYTPTSTLGGRKCEAKQVIVACGFGPSARPSTTVLPAELTHGKWSKQVMGGTEYLYSPVVRPATDPFVVAVQGTSATSSWAVKRAIALGATSILWISRGGFKDANPAGRNTDILEEANKNGWLTIATVKSVKANGPRLKMTLDRAVGKPEDEKKLSTLGEAYRKYYEKNEESAANQRLNALNLKATEITKQTLVDIDHFVYALGADASLPGGAGYLLGPLVNELEAVFDNEKRFGEVPADTTVAFRTADEKLWVVGAAVFRYVGLEKLKEKGTNFNNVAKMMCEAGTPPEGIAAVLASMKAVTGYYDETLKNPQTNDFAEIELWISKLYQKRTGKPIPEKTKRVMADQIVAIRKHTVFGLSKSEVDALCTPDNDFWNEMFEESNGEYTIDRIARLSP